MLLPQSSAEALFGQSDEDRATMEKITNPFGAEVGFWEVEKTSHPLIPSA
jgi:hypothetical protein